MKNYYTKPVALMALMFTVFTGFSQTDAEKAQITNDYNKQNIERLTSEFTSKATIEKRKANQMAKEKNWPLIIEKDGAYMELQKVSETGTPLYYTTFNVDAAKSTRANHLNSGGSLGLNLNGQNMTAHVWDGGLARVSHQEYDGQGGSNRFSAGDNSTALNYHSAHVTGTIIASGVVAKAKGMAPHAKAKGYDWNNDAAEASSASANGMLISNHSYGYATRNSQGQPQLPSYYFGGYITDSRDWDQIMFNAPNYLMVVAAGNDGSDNSANGAPLDGYSGYDKLSGHATAKNGMVVANANDANISSNGSLISVSINSSSSQGPTDDYRIKPDITGNGTGVYSTYDGSNSAYNSITGTSMASPNVAGTLLILQQHAKNVEGSFMRAATLKGLALHTADDVGPNGPDAVYGWGLLNAKRAAEAISNNGSKSKITELNLSNGQTYQITVDADGVNDLMASISWTDRAGTAVTVANSSNPILVNDLDVRVTKTGTTYSPWRLTGVTTNGKGDNNVDPYERVDVANASGTYTITVTHKGSLTGGSQNYSLIVTGLSATPIACTATVPTGLSVSSIAGTTASISWNTVTSATYDVRYRATGTSTWNTTAVSGTTTTLNGLTSETTYEVQVRSRCAGGSDSAYSTSKTFTTTGTQIDYCVGTSKNSSDEYIGRVQLASIDKTSGAQNYSDFTSTSTNLSADETYTITITPKWSGSKYNEGYAVWIDYNNDGDFTDAGELVWSKAASTVSPVSGSFKVPAGAASGATRMRVALKYNGIPTPCEAFNYGEVEDYTVVIGSGSGSDTQAPSVPSNLSASNVTQTTALLSWTVSTDNVGVTGYDLYSGTTLLGTVAVNSANVTGMTANTNYSYTVKAKDAAGNVSGASNVLSFKTLSDAAVNYCASKGGSNYEWIDYVSYGGMTNSTGANGGYGDFTSKTATVAKGSTNQIVFSAGFASSAYTEYWAVWIDLNQNGTFEANEKMVSGSSASAANLGADITIPSSALTGTTRMRVSMKYNAAQTACESFSYGEVEDYTVNITNQSSSYEVLNDVYAEALSNEPNVYDIQLYPNPVANSLNVRVKDSRDANFSISNMLGQEVEKGQVNNRSINVSNLQSGTYIIKVNDGQKPLVKKFIKL
ncbi:T9SS type A sorting domain-containing protein [Bizionia argentinensis JUB59]|uniref:T9SS type A sorting domain-containing protein n=1 Tax=Bizionia argentinensis JUB59 TaxID=1046627 RepID=G2EE90_9FLAO|nr:GEVED domain-containing protein [Bizionia argentinensis]EGV43232.1 T9SS type A sorting domain-containing protein [Bizionia argentinensis JUB59]